MFVLLGAFILVASFIIALISLVREQRKTERAQIQSDEQSKVPAQPEQLQARVDEAVSKHDEAARKLAEMVEKQKAASVSEDKKAEEESNTLNQPFPWEVTNAPMPNNSYTLGDSTEETKVAQSEPSGSFDDITQSSGDDSRLSGVFEIRKQAKAKKAA